MNEERNLPEFIQEYIDLIPVYSEKFHKILQKIRELTDSDTLVSTFGAILDYTNSDLRIRKAVLGSFLVRKPFQFCRCGLLHTKVKISTNTFSI